MNVKYIVIDLSKIDTNKLEEMLTQAYTDGYQKGRECIGGITAPTIPYNGDSWYTTTAVSNAVNTISLDGVNSSSLAVGSNSESHTITLANDIAVAKKP